MTAKLPKCLVPTFEPGEVVQLRSGGHSMTIEAIDGLSANCVWSDKGRLRREAISLEVLKRSTEGTDGIIVFSQLTPDAIDSVDIGREFGNA